MAERADQENSEAQLRTAVSHQGIHSGQHQDTLQSLSQQQSDIQQTLWRHPLLSGHERRFSNLLLRLFLEI
ncbi:hypothetical protein CHARACLAT_028707 [Characodon lateralis]|uniref:Uncharacterized protein n=1 Tax=Characodon lateralis TaxID=208331 RepID=A0ABU7DV13_9TELE|nr:hypothetical protein [Characodon lateralis]